MTREFRNELSFEALKQEAQSSRDPLLIELKKSLEILETQQREVDVANVVRETYANFLDKILIKIQENKDQNLRNLWGEPGFYQFKKNLIRFLTVFSSAICTQLESPIWREPFFKEKNGSPNFVVLFQAMTSSKQMKFYKNGDISEDPETKMVEEVTVFPHLFLPQELEVMLKQRPPCNMMNRQNIDLGLPSVFFVNHLLTPDEFRKNLILCNKDGRLDLSRRNLTKCNTEMLAHQIRQPEVKSISFEGSRITDQQLKDLLKNKDIKTLVVRNLCGVILTKYCIETNNDRENLYENYKVTGQKKDPDLSGMDLSNANFEGADLKGVNFSKSKLWGVNFRGADLRRADFSNTNMDGTLFDNKTKCAEAKFYGATGGPFTPPNSVSPGIWETLRSIFQDASR